MIGHCCIRGRASNRLAPNREKQAGFVSRIISAILPAAFFAVLPKCPLCLAAWLALATGISFSAAAATWLRGGVILLSVVVLVHRIVKTKIWELFLTRS